MQEKDLIQDKRNNKLNISLGVHGTRDLYDDRVRIILLDCIKKYGITKIVTHAEPHGVCEIARKLAQELGIVLELHYLNIRNGRGMFYHRSFGVINSSDFSVVIHDGVSKGTQNEVKLLKKMNKDFEYHKIEKTDDWTTCFDIDIEPLELD